MDGRPDRRLWNTSHTSDSEPWCLASYFRQCSQSRVSRVFRVLECIPIPGEWLSREHWIMRHSDPLSVNGGRQSTLQAPWTASDKTRSVEWARLEPDCAAEVPFRQQFHLVCRQYSAAVVGGERALEGLKLLRPRDNPGVVHIELDPTFARLAADSHGSARRRGRERVLEHDAKYAREDRRVGLHPQIFGKWIDKNRTFLGLRVVSEFGRCRPDYFERVNCLGRGLQPAVHGLRQQLLPAKVQI